MLAFFVASVITITYLVCDERSLLLAKEASVKTRSYMLLVSSLTNFRPLSGFFICYFKRLFRAFVSSLLGLITWVAKERSKDASGW
jgi:hypothetical protein